MKKKTSKKMPPLGSGERFRRGKEKLVEEGKSEESAERIMAWRGRKKYGNAKMQEMASAGRKRKARKKG